MGKGSGGGGKSQDYYGDIAAAICLGPVDELVSLIVDKKLVWPKASDYSASVSYSLGNLVSYSGKVWEWNNVTPSVAGTAPPSGSWIQYTVKRASVANPFLFTVEGYGNASFYWGTSTQTLTSGGFLDTNGHPNYRGTAVLELTQFLFGRERTSSPNIQVVVRKKPQQSIVTGSAANLDTDGQANPIAAWCDIATDSIVGAGIAATDIDATTLQSTADELYANPSKFYVSPSMEGSDSLRAFTKTLLEYYDGWMRRNTAGKIEAGRFLHDSAPPGGLQEITFHDLDEEIELETHDWSDTSNMVFVRFTDSDRSYKDGSAPAPSGFNRAVTGQPRPFNVEMPWIMRRQQASDFAAETAKIVGQPWFAGRLTVRATKATSISAGSLFTLTHDGLSLSIVCRCTHKAINEPPSENVSIEFESERGLAPLPYQPSADGAPSVVYPPAESITLYQLWQPPADLGGSDHVVALLAGRTDATTTSVKLWFRKDAGSSFYELGNQTQWSIKGTLSSSFAILSDKTTSNRARSSNVATITTSAAHGLTTGWRVNISGVSGVGYNADDVAVTVTGSTTFTYYNPGSNEASTADTGGTVKIYDDETENLQCTLAAGTVDTDRELATATQTEDAVNDNALLAIVFDYTAPATYEVMTVKSFRLDGGVYKLKVRRGRFSTTRRAGVSSDIIWIVPRGSVVAYEHSDFSSYANTAATATFRIQASNPAAEADLTDTAVCPDIGYTFSNPNSAMEYTSTPQAVPAASGVLELTHGLGQAPFNVRWTLLCVSTDAGFSPGDEIGIGGLWDSPGATDAERWFKDYANSTKIGLIRDSGMATLIVTHKSTAADTTLTESKWRIVGRASR